jgi:esterase/lipase
MKLLKWLGIILLLFIITYFLGPKPSYPKYSLELPVVPDSAAELVNFVANQEHTHKLKQDNEARIIWANDTTKASTEYAVVYLHGFSGSLGDGDGIHRDFAKKFGCNLYLARIEDHGVDTTEPLMQLTADRMWNSAKEAYAIGRKLGKKVILLSTSTGGTLALKLAAEYGDIAGLLLLSPNIAINDSKAWVLNNHWGLQIARMIKGKYMQGKDTAVRLVQYWNNTYRMEAAVQLEELLETTMKESTFEKIKQPVLMLYYYKDEEHQDPVVKVSAMKRMFQQLGTPDSLKREVPIPNAEAHAIGSTMKSKDVESVRQECYRFAEEILKMKD